MRREVTKVLCLIALLGAGASVAQDRTQSLSMTMIPLPTNRVPIPGSHALLLTITNSSDVETTIGWDGDDYRIMLIAPSGNILVPDRYQHAYDFYATTTQKVPAHGTLKHILSLEQETGQKIPTGTYWVVVTYKPRTWSDAVLTAPAAKMTFE